MTKFLSIIILLFLSSSSLYAQVEDSIQNGYILAIGGGVDDEGLDKFLALIGDTSQAIVIVPTACYDEYIFAENNCATLYINYFKKKGFSNVEVLHTRSRDSANSPDFIKPLKNAKGVWFTGGRQPLLADSYLNTLFHNQLRSILANGGVVGGSSAGATILGSFLVRGQLKNNTIMIGDHVEGFGFLKNTAIDQHVLARNRQFDMLEVVKKHREILGLGIDEGTTIVVHNNLLEVISGSYVAIYDGTFWDGETYSHKKLSKRSKRFYFLTEFDQYDLIERKVLTHLNKKPIDLPTKELEKFVGTYMLDEYTRTIEIIDGKLTINEKELNPFTALEFFSPTNPNRYVFTLDENGNINGLKILSYKEHFFKKS
jgi:cyanophycinase